MVLERLEPRLVWEIFEKVFIATPRESKKEEQIRAKLKTWIPERAKSLGIDLKIAEDTAGNLLIRRNGSKGMESIPSLLFQGHMDMVCETNRAAGFDFSKNPIPVRIQDNGEWVDADGTTLGADNGIGVALALALLLDPKIKTGPLELLITVDEETGLVGAFAIEPDSMGITSKFLINVDSEKLGVITIGSAGGGDTILTKNLQTKKVTGNATFFDLEVTGLFGGHSGVDIDKHRANANKLVARMLSGLVKEMNVHLCEWNGGSKHNAITRESRVKFAVESDMAIRAEELLKQAQSEILSYYKEAAKGSSPLEPDISINWSISDPRPAFSLDESKKIITSVNIIPNGPLCFSANVEGLVETSNNVAIIKTSGSTIEVLLSTRSSVNTELEFFRTQLTNIADFSGWEAILKPMYPGWNPEPNSPFLKFIQKHYEVATEHEVKIEAIHAGLECGIIGAKIPGLQMVSIGPTAENAHTPDERVKISDIPILYEFLKSIVQDLPKAKL
ncbi:MAG: beta-Ala-His dipeptidase [Candidatus Thorarchaeota archaeon]|nr:beta-Ala-His dipeptidase [Candidatus Thorarchaeota archaeon]